jgi:hypothetical protein
MEYPIRQSIVFYGNRVFPKSIDKPFGYFYKSQQKIITNFINIIK